MRIESLPSYALAFKAFDPSRPIRWDALPGAMVRSLWLRFDLPDLWGETRRRCVPKEICNAPRGASAHQRRARFKEAGL